MTVNTASSPGFERLRAVVFDWAGTLVDCGSRCPVQAFAESFSAHGVEVETVEARVPMGLGKREHVAAMFAMPRIAARWEQIHGAPPGEEDIDRVYGLVETSLIDIIARYSMPIPGAVEAVAAMRGRGLRIGSCTGYPRPVAEKMAATAALAGLRPDCLVCATDVPQSRPAPDMCREILGRLKVSDPKTAVKIGDTKQDILEGLRAGMWTIGITLTGSLVGLSEGELAALPASRRDLLERAAGETLQAAGADFLAPDIPSCMRILDFIEEELAIRPA